MKENNSLGLGLILIVAVLPLVCADYNDLCALFADGTNFREPNNCAAYVSCKNGIGTVTTCPNNQLFDKETKKCVATLSGDDYCEDQCKGQSGKWVPDKNNCNGYYYCGTDGAIAGACPDGYNFHQKNQMCVFPADSDCYVVSSICGLLPKSSESFADPENCDKYYQCTKGELKQQSCGKNLYYDIESIKCISKYEVACNAHPLPSNVCGTTLKPKADIFVTDGASCRGYFYCAYKGPKLPDLNPIWNQCPVGLFFSAADQACKDPTEVKCSHNRCEGRGNLLVIAEDKYCQHYNECQNGQVLLKAKCPRDMFFDEHRQACTFTETSYPVCDG